MLLVLLLGGCALFERTQLQPGLHTAVLRGADWGRVYRGGYVAIIDVNGQRPAWATPRQIEVKAGQQFGSFQVILCATQTAQCQPLKLVQLKMQLEAAAAYEVHARETVNGSNEFWVWVEDARTRTVAGGEAPPQR